MIVIFVLITSIMFVANIVYFVEKLADYKMVTVSILDLVLFFPAIALKAILLFLIKILQEDHSNYWITKTRLHISSKGFKKC